MVAVFYFRFLFTGALSSLLVDFLEEMDDDLVYFVSLVGLDLFLEVEAAFSY